MHLHLLCYLLACMLLLGCAGSSRLSQSGLEPFFSGDAFAGHFVGFQLFDPVDDRTLYSHQADKLFTPASNTKILTLFTATQVLGDSLLSLRYKKQDDTLFVWPMGDPTTLHPYFGSQRKALDFLKSQPNPITFCLDHAKVERFGPGWAWDDFPYYYQAERSFLPLYGNVVWFEFNPHKELLTYFPSDFDSNIQLGSDLTIQRTETENHFQLSIPDSIQAHTIYEVPFMTTVEGTADILTQEIGKKICIAKNCPAMENTLDYHSISVDSVYSLFMKNSDNFIAEQLLLMCAGKKLDILDSQLIIDLILSDNLPNIREELKWVDGSGLSRYNLASPNALVSVLTKLLDDLGFDEIKKIFPAGGQSGTIRGRYGSENEKPYVYAKTGTLSNVHCLSGYIVCDSGKKLVFSFMHNNFPGSSADIKSNMAEVLKFIRKEY